MVNGGVAVRDEARKPVFIPSGRLFVSSLSGFETSGTLYVRVFDPCEPSGFVWFDIVSGTDVMEAFTSQLEPAETYRFDFAVRLFGRRVEFRTEFRT